MEISNNLQNTTVKETITVNAPKGARYISGD